MQWVLDGITEQPCVTNGPQVLVALEGHVYVFVVDQHGRLNVNPKNVLSAVSVQTELFNVQFGFDCIAEHAVVSKLS